MARKKKIKIGFFTDTYTPQINGVVTSIDTFKKYLEKQGHTVYIFAPTPRQKNDTKKIVRFPSIKFLFQPEMRVAFPYSIDAVNLLKKIDLDIIHSHDPFSIGLFGMWVAKRKKIPYVHTYHTLYPEYVHYVWETGFTKDLAKKLSRDFCNKCSLIVAPSTKIKKFLKNWGVSKPIEVVPTGADIKDFSLKKDSLQNFRKKYKIMPGDKILIFVGRLGTEKNIKLLIKSLNKITVPNVKLFIAGNGPDKKQLEKLIIKEDLEKKVLLPGYLDKKEVVKAYRASNIFVFSSKTETQGLVIAEAMTAGLPIVAVNDLAIADVVKNNKNGYLTKSNVKEFASKIDILLKNHKLYKKMSKNSLSLAREISAEKQTKKLEKIYFKLLKEKSI